MHVLTGLVTVEKGKRHENARVYEKNTKLKAMGPSCVTSDAR